ncbi:MAG: STAS domain-containing protein [Steroidobacteraceae bacterium]|nr:STAS domain-containing protein [Steroidobacteraceae bacterium]
MIQLVEAAPGRLALRGGLDFSSAATAHEAGLAHFRRDGAREWIVDCSGLDFANSAAVAVLLDWLAVVHRAGGHLRYEGLPDRVRAIAEISEVEELLETGV